jgi:ribonuclease R
MQRFQNNYTGTLIKRNLVITQDKTNYYLHNMEDAIQGDTIQFTVTKSAENGKLAVIQLTNIVQRGRDYYLATILGFKGPNFLVKLYGSDFVFTFPKENHWFPKGTKHLMRFTLTKQLTWVKALDIYSDDEIIRYCFNLEDNLSDDKTVDRLETTQIEDQTSLYTFTIDPIDSKDFDDAISIDPIKNQIHIHIADVSRYVAPGSIMDKRLFQQQFSVYGNQHVYHMCPSNLATNMCSIVPDQTRFVCTISCSYDSMTCKLDPYSATHFRSKILSKRRFHYDEVNTILEREEKEQTFSLEANQLQLAHLIFQQNKCAKRFNETMDTTTKEDDSHAMVEFYMLFANQYIAAYMKSKRIPYIRRVHPAPKQEEKLEEIKKLVFPSTIPSSFRTFLMLKCLSSAYYSAVESGHWALGMAEYAHFTSPIRRYVDIINHRSLFSTGYSMKELEEICAKANEIELRNKQVEEMQSYLRSLSQAKEWQQNKTQLTCIVYSVFVAGFYVYIVENGATAPIYISEVASASQSYFSFHSAEKAWKSESYTIKMFDVLTCKVKQVIDRIELQVLFS